MAATDSGASAAGPIPPTNDGTKPATKPQPMSRRAFLAKIPGTVMALGLAVSYGYFAWMLGRFLYPARKRATGWMFVSRVDEIPPDGSKAWAMPSGAKIVVVRKGEAREVAGFTAFSSTCPHLGCQVHWEPQKSRFFCPCHNGVFDPAGKGIGGPPGQAGQSLPTFPLKVENGLLFIEVPLERLST